MSTDWSKGSPTPLKDLTNPGNYVYTLPSWVDELVKFADALPGTEFSVLSPVPTTFQDLFDTFPPHTGIPPLDVATALLISLPEIDYNVFHVRSGRRKPNGCYRRSDRRRPGNITSGANRSSALTLALRVQQFVEH